MIKFTNRCFVREDPRERLVAEDYKEQHGEYPNWYNILPHEKACYVQVTGGKYSSFYLSEVPLYTGRSLFLCRHCGSIFLDRL